MATTKLHLSSLADLRAYQGNMSVDTTTDVMKLGYPMANLFISIKNELRDITIFKLFDVTPPVYKYDDDRWYTDGSGDYVKKNNFNPSKKTKTIYRGKK